MRHARVHGRTKFSTSVDDTWYLEDGDPCDLTEISATFCFVLFCFVLFFKMFFKILVGCR